MTPFVILGLAVLAVLATTILAFALTSSRRKLPSLPVAKSNISFSKIDPPTNERRVFSKRLPK